MQGIVKCSMDSVKHTLSSIDFYQIAANLTTTVTALQLSLMSDPRIFDQILTTDWQNSTLVKTLKESVKV